MRLGERDKKVYKPLYRSGAFLQPTLHFFGYKFIKTANQRPPTLEYLPNLNVRKRGLPPPPNPNIDITLGARAFRATASRASPAVPFRNRVNIIRLAPTLLDSSSRISGTDSISCCILAGTSQQLYCQPRALKAETCNADRRELGEFDFTGQLGKKSTRLRSNGACDWLRGEAHILGMCGGLCKLVHEKGKG